MGNTNPTNSNKYLVECKVDNCLKDLLCSIALLNNGGVQKKNRLVKAVLEYEDFTTSTVENVHCEFFRATFGEHISKIDVSDDSTLEILSRYMQYFEETPGKPMDVRLMFTLFYKDSSQAYCMNRFGLFYDTKSGKYFRNECLYRCIITRCN